jgi:hypothetical protein
VGPSHGDAALAADGVIIAIRAAANNSTILIPSDLVTRIAGFRASARMFSLFMIYFLFLLWPSLTACFEEVISGASLMYCVESGGSLRGKFGKSSNR